MNPFLKPLFLCLLLTPALTTRTAADTQAWIDPHAFRVLAPGDFETSDFRSALFGELFRQALFVAAFDEARIPIGDGLLGDPRPRDPFIPVSVQLANKGEDEDGEDELHYVYRVGDTEHAGVKPNSAHPYRDATELAERLSREDLANLLRQTTGADEAAGGELAPRPVSGQPWVSALDEFLLWQEIRLHHEDIRELGENEHRLAKLVQAYALLGQVTSHYWTSVSSAFTARSLLYDQRLEIRYGKRSPGLTQAVRCFALAMAGLHHTALEALDEARAARSNAPWLQLLDDYLHFRHSKLVAHAEADGAFSGLACHLLINAMAKIYPDHWFDDLRGLVREKAPLDLALVHIMGEQTRDGASYTESVRGPNILYHGIFERLPWLDGFPESVAAFLRDEAKSARPQKLGQLLDYDSPVPNVSVLRRKLIEASHEDGLEPSLATLGQLCLESHMSFSAVRLKYIDQREREPAMDAIDALAPTLEGHPLAPAIFFYDRRVRGNRKELVATFSRLDVDGIQQAAMQVFFEAHRKKVPRLGPVELDKSGAYFRACRDVIYDDLNRYFATALPGDEIKYSHIIDRVSPHNLSIAMRALYNREADLPALFERFSGMALEHPVIAEQMAYRLDSEGCWQQAQPFLEVVFRESRRTDMTRDLARIYLFRKDPRLDDLIEHLRSKDHYSKNSIAFSMADLAESYLIDGDLDAAMKYARLAGETGEQRGLRIHAWVSAVAGDKALASQLFQKLYGGADNLFDWYASNVKHDLPGRDDVHQRMLRLVNARDERLSTSNYDSVYRFGGDLENALKHDLHQARTDPNPYYVAIALLTAVELGDLPTARALIDEQWEATMKFRGRPFKKYKAMKNALVLIRKHLIDEPEVPFDRQEIIVLITRHDPEEDWVYDVNYFLGKAVLLQNPRSEFGLKVLMDSVDALQTLRLYETSSAHELAQHGIKVDELIRERVLSGEYRRQYFRRLEAKARRAGFPQTIPGGSPRLDF